jgi:hypothetical protein
MISILAPEYPKHRIMDVYESVYTSIAQYTG